MEQEKTVIKSHCHKISAKLPSNRTLMVVANIVKFTYYHDKAFKYLTKMSE